jgi:uncharacterized protein
MRETLYSMMAGALLVLLVGCASTEPTRFYVLTAPPGGSQLQGAPNSPCLTLGVGPINLPEYVNRPQIVTRASQNELVLAPFDRWAEPLSDTFSRVLAENISRLMCTKNIAIFPWRVPSPPDFRVEAEVTRMDGELGKEAVLEAWWTVSGGPDKKVIESKQSKFVEPVNGPGYEALVQAQSRILAALSKEMTQAISKGSDK